MNDVFDINGKCVDDDNKIHATLSLKELTLYINIPEWIEERNVYNLDGTKVIGTIKPKKYGGLTYYIYDVIGDYAKIKTVVYGICLVKITEKTVISNRPLYESGCY